MRSLDALLRTGEFTLLTGPVVHAGPAARGRRMMLFFSFHLAGGEPYNSRRQYGPTTSAVAFNSARLIVRQFRAWARFDPSQYVVFAESGAEAFDRGERTLWELAYEWQDRGYRLDEAEDVPAAKRHHTEAE